MADAIVDRLISGAGAVTASADELTRGFGGDAESRLLRGRPGSILVAVVCFVLAGLLLAVGVENRDPSIVTDFSASSLANDDGLGRRTTATVEGALASVYVESYLDTNGNDLRDQDEVASAWYYWLVDPTDRQGVTVRSERPPSAVYTTKVRGRVIEDPSYIDPYVEILASTASGLGLTLDTTKLIEGRDVLDGPTEALDFSQPVPGDGSIVEISGSRLALYVPICPRDPNHVCPDSEADGFDIVMYDPISKQAITVVTTVSPEFTPPVTLSGIVRRDEHAVDDAIQIGRFHFRDPDLTVSPHYLLDEAVAPADPRLAPILAAVLAALGAIILVGLAGRYLVFRRTPGPGPAAAATLAPGERLPLHITGDLRTAVGRIHVREQPAELVRFVTRASDPPETALIVERTGRPQGIPVGYGEVERVAVGEVYPVRGSRPAIRVATRSGPVLLSFDDTEARDRAAAELLDAAETPETPAAPETQG